MKNYIWAALLTVCGALSFGSSTYAQSARTGADDTELTEVVVTGSRVIQNGNDSPTPLTVLNPDKLFELQPTTLSDIVNLVPSLQGSLGTGTAASSGTRNGAASYLNLRDLGFNRTLVLYDGHRLAGNTATQTSNVDITAIPQLLLERVDVVTGGASAVYGTDAVAGVVNFVTNNHFNGVKAQASGGLSTYGDDRILDTGIAAGTNLFGERGHIEVSYQFHDDPGILSRSARPFFAADTGGAGAGTAASPYHNVPNEVFGNTSFGGLITGGPLAGNQFAYNGVLSPFVHGVPTGTSNIESGGNGAYYATSSIKSAEVYNQFFGRFDYNLSDSVHAYAQIAFTVAHSWDNYQSPNLKLAIGYNNPFLSSIQQPYQGLLAAQQALTPAGSFTFNRIMLNTPRANDMTKTGIAIAGLEGTIGKYHWNVALDYDRNEVSPADVYNVNEGNFLAAANAVLNPANGQTICHAALSNPRYANCVPVNLFGPTSQSAAAMNYFLQQTYDISVNTLYDISASITGAPFSTWAGPVNTALSTEFHRITWVDTNNANPGAVADCAGIQFACTQGVTPLWLQGTNFNTTQLAGHPLVMQNVAEIAYEANVPLLKDLPLVQALDLDGAVRYADYDKLAGGHLMAWKIGLDWHVNDVLTVRATRSRDVRAPTLNELYGQATPGTPTPSPITDLHTSGSGSVPIFQNNNPNLKPELADTVTAGIVIQPVPSFSASIDLFHTTVHDVIFSLSGQSATVQAGCEASGGTSPLCSLFARPLPFSDHTGANFPTALYAELLNVASLQTYGADLESNFSTTLFKHPFTLRALVSYQPHLLYNEGPAGHFDVGDTDTGVSLYPATPSVKFTVIGTYDFTDHFSVSLLEKGRNSMKASAVPTFVFVNDRDPAIAYTNLTLTYSPTVKVGTLKAFFNVSNLFNAYPKVYYPGAFPAPGTGNVNPSYLPTDDDPVGRYFTLGVRYGF